ncbi:YbaB/EbfC family nucleoid-associated protein [Actinoplanes utahensis]|uniref:Uncharacterized protein n=1 Tax=Actinoplanes utahensis TaxID=1869 RepID=A0A0A6USL9_ACTUT|nr:YbaB/EbfC family nucleoid-associated protein [Actinoplanes utahensis]KHD77983.1 hypothetical protein MB27_07665 [Actinoplanes utahensis]GIF29969.1 hypothetical protein Aut01nite_29550 [Actinoplanes utahensis]
MNPYEIDFGDRLRGMTVTGTSPDGQIRATVSGDMRLELRLRPGAYDQADERGLSRQLAGLGATTWVAWERERREIYRRYQGLSTEEAEADRRTPRDSRYRLFEEGLRRLECQALSPSEVLHVRTVGMTEWHVDIEPGTLRRLREPEFVQEVVSAFGGLIQDRERRLTLLKAEHFDLGIPRSWLDRTR